MLVINVICNGCRLVVVGCTVAALNLVVFNTWLFLGFFTYEICVEFKKSCGNAGSTRMRT